MSDVGLAFLPRTAKPAEEATSTSYGLLNLSKSRTLATRKSPLRRSRLAEKKIPPYLVAVVANPGTDFATAAAELAARVAPQRDSGVQGILVLPRGTAEWRFAKAISAAGRQGVFTHVSPLVDLQAGARRILSQLLKDGKRFDKHITDYSSSMHKQRQATDASR